MASQKKGYYLCNFDIYDAERVQTGVDRKVINQLRCFNESGLVCEFVYCPYADSRLRRGIGSLPSVPDGTLWPEVDTLRDASFLYIRRPMYSSKEFIGFLKAFRHQNPEAKVIIEIPSYPYDKEFSGISMQFALRKDRRYRNQWKKYVDYIADLSGEKTIFGLPVLPIINGIDLGTIRVRRPSYEMGGRIEMVFSAFFGPWHGCDLLLSGLANYYQAGGNRDVVLHLAGGGNLINELAAKVKKLGIESHVVMHGALSQNQLDELFDQCSFAVGSLGLHRRSDNCRDSSLKTREYLAKGMPFVYAGQVDVFEVEPVDFCLQLSSVEQPIDINKIVSFHDALYGRESEDDLIARIREYAKKTVSMEKAMKAVIDTLLND